MKFAIFDAESPRSQGSPRTRGAPPSALYDRQSRYRKQQPDNQQGSRSATIALFSSASSDFSDALTKRRTPPASPVRPAQPTVPMVPLADLERERKAFHATLFSITTRNKALMTEVDTLVTEVDALRQRCFDLETVLDVRKARAKTAASRAAAAKKTHARQLAQANGERAAWKRKAAEAADAIAAQRAQLEGEAASWRERAEAAEAELAARPTAAAATPPQKAQPQQRETRRSLPQRERPQAPQQQPRAARRSSPQPEALPGTPGHRRRRSCPSGAAAEHHSQSPQQLAMWHSADEIWHDCL